MFWGKFDKFRGVFAFTSRNLIPDKILLSETWFTHDSRRELDGYRGHHITRPIGHGGCNSVFVNYSISSFLNPDVSYKSIPIEKVTISLKFNESELFFLSCYRPHSGTGEGFVTDLCHVFNSPILVKKNILLGDLNINSLIENPAREHFKNFTQSFYFVPWITKPTRFSSNNSETPTLLDQIWTKFADKVTTGFLSIDIIGQWPIFCIFPSIMKNILTTKCMVGIADLDIFDTLNLIPDLRWWHFSYYEWTIL